MRARCGARAMTFHYFAFLPAILRQRARACMSSCCLTSLFISGDFFTYQGWRRWWKEWLVSWAAGTFSDMQKRKGCAASLPWTLEPSSSDNTIREHSSAPPLENSWWPGADPGTTSVRSLSATRFAGGSHGGHPSDILMPHDVHVAVQRIPYIGAFKGPRVAVIKRCIW